MHNVKRRNVFVSSERAGSKEFVTIADADTGEILSQYWKQTKEGQYIIPPTGKLPQFYKVYVTNWQDIIKKKRLTLNEVGLFMSLLSFLDWESPYIVHPTTHKNLSCSGIADLLGLHREHIRQLLDRLCEKGMIAKVNRGVGCPCHYMLNCNIVHFGKYMRDLNDAKVFVNCAYGPVVSVEYRERPNKSK